MIECATIANWLPLPSHTEVTFYYLFNGRRCLRHWRLPVGLVKTPHEIDRQILKFKQFALTLKDSEHVERTRLIPNRW